MRERRGTRRNWVALIYDVRTSFGAVSRVSFFLSRSDGGDSEQYVTSLPKADLACLRAVASARCALPVVNPVVAHFFPPGRGDGQASEHGISAESRQRVKEGRHREEDVKVGEVRGRADNINKLPLAPQICLPGDRSSATVGTAWGTELERL